MKSPYVTTQHLNRKAVIYIRQSSLHQVLEHEESQRRQYQLVEVATALGWSESSCEIIDDDQAISAAQSYNRPGYQRLTALVALREVGIIIGLEVGRLARNCLDWYQLLQIAAVFDVLVADEEGVYNLSQFNDRLLLGLKGIFAEVELHQIQARMVKARMSKAARGELRFRLPIGLEWDELTERPRTATDQSVYDALALAFRLFEQLQSIRAVLRHLRREQLDFPYQRREGGYNAPIEWRHPTADALRALFNNPLYAGVYCYGRRQTTINPLQRSINRRMRPRDEWIAFLPDHYIGYITLAQFEENRRTIRNNVYRFPTAQGAPRSGKTLVQGLVVCAHCGRKMHIRYAQNRASYVCEQAHIRFGDPVCNRASSRHVDGIVTYLFLKLVNAHAIDVAATFDAQLQQEAQQIDHLWQQKVSRLQYEANLARRRYEAVDPDNRLVAQTLETEWNQKLTALSSMQQQQHSQRPTTNQLTHTLTDMKQIVAQLPTHWRADTMTEQDKKALVRCLLQHVVVDGRGDLIYVTLHWQGGSTSQLEIPKRMQTPAYLFFRIREMAHFETDYTIAKQLNAEKFVTACKRRWTARHVQMFRRFHEIRSAFDSDLNARLSTSPYITGAEARSRLGIKQDSLHEWCQLGLLDWRQDGPHKRLWIRWDDTIEHRLAGNATQTEQMVSVRTLRKSSGKSRRQIFDWAHDQQFLVYRLQRGRAYKFFVLVSQPSNP